MSIITVTEENFRELTEKSEKPVLLDFWATWCGPCRMIAPIIEEIANERDDIIVGKVNVDEQGAIAAMCGIASIPTLMLVKDGQVAATKIGYCQKDEIIGML